MAEKCHRISENSLDEDNQKVYKARATEHTRIADETGEKITDEPVEKFAESGIINTGSEKMALENQRYGRNKNTLVNKSYIESGEYRRKYDNVTDVQAVNKSLYNCAKKALRHRSGTVFEDMYWIDSNTGEIILSVTDSKDERAIAYTERIKNIINKNENVVTIHTHPSSMPPSVSDLNSCFENKYKMGVIACHNGKVFGYTSNEKINERLYNMYIENFIKEGFDDYESQYKTLEKLSRTYDMKFWEVL
ncbi:MAG: hypothetical protein MSH11_08390 [Ruminococcus sp.]|nr:hypothetical protein [Ruminococcus sp.]